jgi:outer membrane protein OmpA-like peptidoglycan-associated protein
MTERTRWFLSLLLLSAAAQAALPPLIVDGDGDGVSDEVDDCPYTPPGIQMNERGCPLHADPQDDCPYTPPGAVVDAHGCALDADFDGVANGIDRCLNTALGALVDERGCASGQLPAPLLGARPAPPPVTTPPSSAPVPTRLASQPVQPATAPPVETLHARPEPLAPLAPLGIAGGAVSVAMPNTPALPLATAQAAVPPSQPQVSPGLQAALLAEEQSRAAKLAGLPAPAVSATTNPASVSAPAPAPALPLPESVSESLVFAARSAELSLAAARKLEALAPALKALATRSANAHVSVAAYADQGEGAKASRYAIRRSELMRAWLLAHGVPAERIRTSIRVLDSGEAAGNRRVDIRTVN